MNLDINARDYARLMRARTLQKRSQAVKRYLAHPDTMQDMLTCARVEYCLNRIEHDLAALLRATMMDSLEDYIDARR